MALKKLRNYDESILTIFKKIFKIYKYNESKKLGQLIF